MNIVYLMIDDHDYQIDDEDDDHIVKTKSPMMMTMKARVPISHPLIDRQSD